MKTGSPWIEANRLFSIIFLLIEAVVPMPRRSTREAISPARVWRYLNWGRLMPLASGHLRIFRDWRSPMDALGLLKEDHDKVTKMLEELESTTERGVKTREELFTKVKKELEVHETIEEEIFYPSLKDHPKTKEIALEAYEEHHVVDTLMAEIEGVPYDDEKWGAKFKVMKENLEHHIEEEESEMFKQAKQVFEPTELTQIGESMMKRKEELMQQSASEARTSK
jgi:hypothetical protein